MPVVTQLNEEVLRPSPRANPDRKEIRSGLTSAFVPGLRRAYTATATIKTEEAYRNFLHSNNGAAGGIQLNLPDALPGMKLGFLAEVAQAITVNPQDTDQIEVLTNAVGDAIAVAVPAVGDRITLRCDEAGVWVPETNEASGTWADVN